ncbi:MAG: cytochrome c maturation protein CcmE [Comamonadaceae bacterium]|nr:cytochrome c maturation protein CcmE [Burkholderiales bacterium]MEB2349285.1 cytochrome c maturation protein CcmE [Comamonadaceae bacterium]
MKSRTKRGLIIVGALATLGVASALVLNAFQDNLVFFFSPSQVATREAPVDRSFRLGGLVEEGSVKRSSDSLTVQFTVTDGAKAIPVTYNGLLPDMFREGKGVVTQGRLDDSGTFHADQVLAKHDENYTPKEVADALKTTALKEPDAAAGLRQ